MIQFLLGGRIMEEHIRKAMNDSIIMEAGKYYGLRFEEIEYYGGFENFIYIYKRQNIEYILRLVHSGHKAYNQVLAEIEFIDYLARNGASVSTVIHSVKDNIVEKVKIDNESYFTVTSFIKGKGGRVREEVKKPEFWQNLGKQIGLLHKLTKTFKPKHKRIVWEEDTLYKLAPKFLSGKEDEILKKLNERMKKISSFPKNTDNYGLIHTDLHFGNMVIDNFGNLTFFDFDDSAYKHFISDIAIVLFYHFAYRNPTIEIKTEKSLWILNNFFKGYKTHNNLPKEELLHLQDFLKLRELTLYIVIIAGGEETIQSEWGQNYINS
ncbi:phosphotransferase, partial [Lutibacter sp.]|uniref:phosphotransferase enzyme family protein n=1 Tax=Lutibacter sp. TaxID=1925666 RepID=UPI001A205E7F